jgi:hypothetical protein
MTTAAAAASGRRQRQNGLQITASRPRLDMPIVSFNGACSHFLAINTRLLAPMPHGS